MSDMHHTLQLELHIALNRKLIKNIPMFKAISDSDCLIDLIEKLEPKIFIPGEYICLQGELGREMYIIVRGQVQVLLGGIQGLRSYPSRWGCVWRTGSHNAH